MWGGLKGEEGKGGEVLCKWRGKEEGRKGSEGTRGGESEGKRGGESEGRLACKT